MATPTEQIQYTTTIPEWAKTFASNLLGRAETLSELGYQPYARPVYDAQGNQVFDKQGRPVLEGIQRVEDFNKQQIAAFNRIAAMQEADQLRQATGMAGLAGLNAPQLGRYQAYGERVPMGGVDNWGAGEKYDKSKLPSNFDWQAYLAAPQNADLVKAGIDTPEEAERHYAKYGAGEGRSLGTPGTSFESSAFYNPPTFERMPTSFERVSADALGQQQMAGIPGVMARGIEAGRMGPAREVMGERVSAPTMAGYERVGAPGEYGIERAAGAGYGPLSMGAAERVAAPSLQQYQMGQYERVGGPGAFERVTAPSDFERVGLGALQQYRVGAPERISGPMGPERVSGPQLREFQMSPAQQVRAAELERLGMVSPGDINAPELQQYRMGAPERVGAEKFGLGAMQEYMSPYMRGVVEQQKRAAAQDYLRQLPGIGAAAARAGGRGVGKRSRVPTEGLHARPRHQIRAGR